VKLLKNIAFGIGGFVLGAYLANGFLELLDLSVGTIHWFILLMAGILGAVLMLTLFEWALVILSSTVGALLISQSIPLDPPASQIIFFGLLFLGMMVQIRHEKPHGFQKTIPPGPGDGMPGTVS
jgi:drug/metabolite transporter (DMT)-like permease